MAPVEGHETHGSGLWMVDESMNLLRRSDEVDCCSCPERRNQFQCPAGVAGELTAKVVAFGLTASLSPRIRLCRDGGKERA